jgi:hypothetical protein
MNDNLNSESTSSQRRLGSSKKRSAEGTQNGLDSSLRWNDQRTKSNPRQLVDPFVPSRQPKRTPAASAKPKPRPAPSASQLKHRFGNEFVAPHAANPVQPIKPALDHLRPFKPSIGLSPDRSKEKGVGSREVAAGSNPRPFFPPQTNAIPARTMEMKPKTIKAPAAPLTPYSIPHTPAAKGRMDFTPPAKRQRRGMGILKIVAAIVGGLTFGVLVQSQTAGEVLIGVYAAVALIWRIESRVTFMMALGALVAIMAISLLRSGQPLANNFAVYAFLLLAVGTVSLAIETRRGY